MLMMLKDTGAMVELMSPDGLWDPYCLDVRGCRLAGEEMQEPEAFNKSDLAFLSGEALPRCWLNAHYRDDEWQSYRRDPTAAGPAAYYGA